MATADQRHIDFLIVDDSRDAADSLAEVLTLLGHSARVAYGGRAALEAIREVQPLCVMLDINMPDMNGLELTRILRSEFGDDVVLVAVTGGGSDDPKVVETFALVDHYFTKPVSPQELKRLLFPD